MRKDFELLHFNTKIKQISSDISLKKLDLLILQHNIEKLNIEIEVLQTREKALIQERDTIEKLGDNL